MMNSLKRKKERFCEEKEEENEQFRSAVLFGVMEGRALQVVGLVGLRENFKPNRPGRIEKI